MANVSKSYLISVGDTTLNERRDMRGAVMKVLIDNAQTLALRVNVNDMVIRDVLPNADFGITDVGAVVTDAWLVPGAGVVGTELQYFSAALPNDRVVGFYGISYESVPLSISRVRFTLGAASVETRGIYQIEAPNSRLETAGYLTSPVIYNRTEVARVMVMPRLAFAAFSQRLALLGMTLEPYGNQISRPPM